MIEILAPVGSPAHLDAAVRCGADAVYLGLKDFGARASAVNFTPSELRDAVSRCHAAGMRVYVTVNTLITNRELDSLKDTLADCCRAGVDAILVQDMALLRIVREYCPDLTLHASTQAAVHNAAGVNLLAKMGFSRAVLARELSLEEIALVRKDTDAELETFIHGALCVSMSGGCYLSAFFGARSANRGRCAGPCRLDFRAPDHDNALSLKDMGCIPYARRLEELGVASLKIEGRLKRPEYVAATVDALRKALAGEEYDAERLEKVFSHGGLTTGYMDGERSREMFGVRRDEDAAAANSLYPELHELYRNENARVDIDADLTLTGDGARLRFSDGENAVEAVGGEALEPISEPMSAATAEKFVASLGGTVFREKSFRFENPEGLTMRGGDIKRLRREAADALYAKRAEIKPIEFGARSPERGVKEIFEIPVYELIARFETPDQIPDNAEGALIVLPMRNIREVGGSVAAEVPYFVSPADEENVVEKLADLRERGLSLAWCENVGGAALALRAGLKPCLGFGFNIINRLARRVWSEELSPELTVFSVEHNAADLPLTGCAAACVYGHLPLMRFRACPLMGETGCGSCAGGGELTDRTGRTQRIICSARKYSTLLNGVPLYVADRDEFRPFSPLAYFTTEGRERAGRIIDLIRSRRPFDGERTTGLYYKELK